MRRNLQRFIDNPNLLADSLQRTESTYRPHDPGWYLYRKVVAEADIGARLTQHFIELVYTTLIAWNMDSRRARLAEFDVFMNSIVSRRESFQRLASFRVELLTQGEMESMLASDAYELFYNLDLVADSKPRLVTCSKTLHFFLPDLFIPIDRTYTLNYFYGNSNIPAAVDRQFKKFREIHLECRRFASSVDLAQFLNQRWNANVPKIIDNTIIGYMKGGHR